MSTRHNVYTCDSCKQWIVTVDREEGVTPMMLRCRATKDCNGTMFSAFYQVPAELQGAQPTYEWRKPETGEYLRSDPATREHVDRGGLLIYPINRLTPQQPSGQPVLLAKPPGKGNRSKAAQRREAARARTRELLKAVA
jgi:hypothetical protein